METIDFVLLVFVFLFVVLLSSGRLSDRMPPHRFLCERPVEAENETGAPKHQQTEQNAKDYDLYQSSYL
jgi:hypothetical protein